MDVLSDVITSVRAGQPGAGRVEWHSPWGVRFHDDPGTAGFLVVLRGSCWLLPGAGEPVPLGVGDVVFAPFGDGYGLADSPDTPLADPDTLDVDENLFADHPAGGTATVTLCGGYRIDPGRTHPMLRDLPSVIHLPAHLGQHSELRAAIGILGAEIETPRLGADAVVPVLLDMLLLYTLRAWFEDQPRQGTATGWAAALADPAVSAALDAVHRDPAHPWTVQTLAATAGLSRAAFSRRFTALVGQPPLTYLTWWRLTLAGELLRDTDAPIQEIASRVGYSSEFAFAHAFKRQHGTAPGAFRGGARAASPPVPRSARR